MSFWMGTGHDSPEEIAAASMALDTMGCLEDEGDEIPELWGLDGDGEDSEYF